MDRKRDEAAHLSLNIKQVQEKLDESPDTATKKELEEALAQMKARLEAAGNEESELQSRKSEAEEQARLEQAKLGELQDQLERLDKALESEGPRAGSTPR